MNKPEQNPQDPSANDEEEAIWLDLVARLEQTSSDGVDLHSPRSLRESLQEDRSTFDEFDPLGLARVEDEAPSPDPDRAQAPLPADRRESGFDPSAAGHGDDDEEDEGFVPEEPPSLVGADPLTVLAWTGAVGGPVALLLTAIFWRSAPLLAIVGIIAVFIAAVGYLVMRLPKDRQDDGDDGAVV